MSDTPPQVKADYGCGKVVSCGNATYEVEWQGRLGYADIQGNLMGFNPESCKKTFTSEQSNRCASSCEQMHWVSIQPCHVAHIYHL